MLRKVIRVGLFSVLAWLALSAIARACEIGWDRNQPTQVQAASDGTFSFGLDTTFEADYDTCHTVSFGIADPEGNNLKNCTITPSTFYNRCDNNGINGTRWHNLHTVNAGELDDKEEDGLFITDVIASSGFCTGEHECTVLHP